eukprot:361982-Chlamydomonas_euryale.AAC.1
MRGPRPARHLAPGCRRPRTSTTAPTRRGASGRTASTAAARPAATTGRQRRARWRCGCALAVAAAAAGVIRRAAQSAPRWGRRPSAQQACCSPCPPTATTTLPERQTTPTSAGIAPQARPACPPASAELQLATRRRPPRARRCSRAPSSLAAGDPSQQTPPVQQGSKARLVLATHAATARPGDAR